MTSAVYPVEIAGLKRDLPICRVNENLQIAAFIMFGDAKLTESCARDMLKIAPEFDVLLTAEAKSIPLIHEMARQCGAERYVIARKKPKLYMRELFEVSVKSITTAFEQKLYLDQPDADFMKGKRILIVDDVVSTGASLQALETLVEKAGGTVCGKLFAMAEGKAALRKDVQFLGVIPLFDGEGKPLPLDF